MWSFRWARLATPIRIILFRSVSTSTAPEAFHTGTRLLSRQMIFDGNISPGSERYAVCADWETTGTGLQGFWHKRRRGNRRSLCPRYTLGRSRRSYVLRYHSRVSKRGRLRGGITTSKESWCPRLHPRGPVERLQLSMVLERLLPHLPPTIIADGST